jgi:hypothetical protein
LAGHRPSWGLSAKSWLTGVADNEMMKLRVECYAGVKADERPVRFQLDERDYLVEEVLDQWYGPEDTFFKVRADDRNLYIPPTQYSSRRVDLRIFPSSQVLVGR